MLGHLEVIEALAQADPAHWTKPLLVETYESLKREIKAVNLKLWNFENKKKAESNHCANRKQSSPKSARSKATSPSKRHPGFETFDTLSVLKTRLKQVNQIYIYIYIVVVVVVVAILVHSKPTPLICVFVLLQCRDKLKYLLKRAPSTENEARSPRNRWVTSRSKSGYTPKDKYGHRNTNKTTRKNSTKRGVRRPQTKSNQSNAINTPPPPKEDIWVEKRDSSNLFSAFAATSSSSDDN